jgi:endonuclease YncB( thermonuclease family)
VRYDVFGRALEALIAGVKVRCEMVERDRHGRLVAKVFSPNGVDIGRRLVLGVLAYSRYAMDYVAAEGEARQARRGKWRGTIVKPWVWRASPPRGRRHPLSLQPAQWTGHPNSKACP